MQVVCAPTIRVRAADFGREADFGARTVQIPGRGLNLGDAVRLEVSLGALADEVDFVGKVAELSGSDDGCTATIVLRHEDLAGLQYVEAVIKGQRDAAARGSRRLASSMTVNWTEDGRRRSSTLRDISRGGAFIVAPRPPEVGTQIELELRAELDERLVLRSIVSWVRRSAQGDASHAGFGVHFRVSDAADAERLREVLAHHQAA